MRAVNQSIGNIFKYIYSKKKKKKKKLKFF